MKPTYRHSLSALALLATHAAVLAQQATPTHSAAEASNTVLGPGTGLLPLAPIVVAFEPAPEDEAAGETGRLFHAGPLPQLRAGDPRLVRFSAPGAAAYRLYLEGVALPPGARLFLYGLDAAGQVTAVFGPYEKSGPLGDGAFRSRVIPGVEVTVEIQGMEDGPVPLRIPWVGAINAGLLAEMRNSKDPSLEESPEQRRPPRAGRTQVEFNGRVVSAEIIGDQVVIEGDIVVGPAKDLEAAGGKTAPGGPRTAVMRTESSGRWPGGVVPFDGALSNDSRVTAAIQTWTTRMNGVISFVPRTNEPDFIRFSATSENVCSSGIGRTSGARTVQVAVPCSTGNLRHEIGHALGFQHEQSREDRDTFVKIVWDNIESGREHNFDRATGSANTDLGPYDFGSLMHYPLDGFSKNGQNTIVPLVAVPAGVTVGQRNSPSDGDVNAVKSLYGVFVSKTIVNVPSGGGTFSVNVSAPSDRFWAAKDDADWVSITSGLSGTGNGTIQFTVGSNLPVLTQGAARGLVLSPVSLFPGPRTANLRIALAPALLVNATVQIVQAAPDCTYSVSPAKINAEPEAGTYAVTVTTAPHCTWGTSESLSWAQVTPSSGQGTATVSVKLTPNVNSSSIHPVPAPKRTGSIVVAGKTVTIEQRGGCPLCE
jgi:hypothetical protein